ncbi:IS66 family transposase [Orrella sp. 11846]|uniref:IS66 family transposase n=1 Tax=Orrella sp. 11846 TaxID=3409913 RepID=UPI003B5B08BF
MSNQLPEDVQALIDAALIRQQKAFEAQIEQTVQLRVEQEMQAQTRALQAQLEQETKVFQARLESQFDDRVKEGVFQKVAEILEQLRLARHRQFGPSSESGQGTLFNEVELLAGEADEQDDDAQPIATPKRKKPRKPNVKYGGRVALPEDLPRVKIYVDVPEEQRIDALGRPMVRIGEETSEQLDIIPMLIRVLQIIRPKYAPIDGNSSPVIAPVLPTLLPRSNLSDGFMAMLLTTKYADGLPLNRFTKVLERSGVKVSRQTLARNVIKVTKALQPLANLMRDTLLEGPIIHMDETTVQVLKEEGRAATKKSYMWAHTGGPPGQSVVMFDYEPARRAGVASRLLEGWQGYLMTDQYSGYNRVGSKPGVTHLACMAHARRKFVDAQRASANGKSTNADKALKFFARLYRLEKRVKNAPDALRHRVRQKLSKQTLDEMHAWMQDLLPTVAHKGKLGQALAYLNNAWPKLIRYIERPDLPIGRVEMWRGG